MSSRPLPVAAYVGIDVAFAKRKRLPVAVSIRRNGILEPLPLASAHAQPPRGEGNLKALDRDVVHRFADEVARYLQEIESEFDLRIERIAIDAPSDPRLDTLPRRACETALDRRGISCIATPNQARFDENRGRALAHIEAGGTQARLPAANQIWMLVGFALFRRLRKDWECIEVFSQAIAATLGAAGTHKRFPDGLRAQLSAAAAHTGWPNPFDEASLRGIGHGAPHDRLDAYLSSWIASLPEELREPLGNPPNDVIWVPRLSVLKTDKNESIYAS